MVVYSETTFYLLQFKLHNSLDNQIFWKPMTAFYKSPKIFAIQSEIIKQERQN